MLLLTNCEAIQRNIRTAVLTYGPNEMRSVQKTKVRIFSVWNEQLVNKRLYGIATMKLSEKCLKTDEVLLEAQFSESQTKNIRTKSLLEKFS